MTKKTNKKTETAKKETVKKADKKLIKMVKGDLTADVHVDMVEDYKTGGYKEV